MRIAVDMQGAQSTSSRNRRIGRYTMALVQGIARNRGDHEIILALTGAYAETIEPIRAAFDGLLPQVNIRIWHPVVPINAADHTNLWRRRASELLREVFLESLRPDAILVTSMFEGYSDDIVTSIKRLNSHTTVGAILFDLIPFLHGDIYLLDPAVRAWYEEKIEQIKLADVLLSISESSRQEGIRHLGLSDEKSVNISTAATEQFRPTEYPTDTQLAVRNRYGLSQSYVMYTGGIDHRKNIEGLIKAFCALPEPVKQQHQLAIVCAAEDRDRQRLLRFARDNGAHDGDIVFTGFVSDDDLVALYNLCKTFVFASWHEGFGLPALEAMSCGRAVIASNSSSLPEVVGRTDALFDPHDHLSISKKLLEVLSCDDFRSELERHALAQSRKFSWDATAQKAIASLENAVANRVSAFSANPNRTERPSLAFVSPLPPLRSGISDYSAVLLWNF